MSGHLSMCLDFCVFLCLCTYFPVAAVCVSLCLSLSLCEPVFLCIYCKALHVSGSCVFVGPGACEFTPPALTFSMPPLSGPSHFPVNPSPSRDPAADLPAAWFLSSWAPGSWSRAEGQAGAVYPRSPIDPNPWIPPHIPQDWLST